MVQVIDRLEDADNAECIEFKVRRSPVDPERILGHWQHEKLEPVGPKGMVAIGQNELRPGGLAEREYQRVVAYADLHGVPFLWINDPHALFPSAKRPQIAM
jgi:hypothetical protein